MADGIRLGGAFYELSADDAKLTQALARSQAQAKSSSDAIARSTGQASTATDASMRRMAQSTQQAGAGFGTLARGAAGFVTAAAGITTGAAAIHQAMNRIAESTQRAAQTQFQLGRQFGTSATEMATFANGLAAATGRSNQAAQEGVARFGVLMRGYGLTAVQTKELTKVTLDLAAANGVDTVEAFERVIGVFRDGGESAEKLGLVLNDTSVKAFANLTAEQRKNFEQMDAVSKSQIRYNELIRQSAAYQGAATERANSAVGAFDKLDASIDNLAVTLGKRFAPATTTSASAVGTLLTATDQFLRRADPQALAAIASQMGAIGQAIAGAIRLFPSLGQPPGDPTPAPPDPGTPGATPGGLSHEAARQAIIALQEQRRQQAKRELEAADKANDATAESAIRAIDKERKAKERWYDEEKQRIEHRRTYQLDDIEARKKAALLAIEAERHASKEHFDLLIEQAEREKKFRIEAAEEAGKQATRALDARKIANDHAREAEDRRIADAREQEARSLADAREHADQDLADRRRKSDQELADRREQEGRSLTDARSKEDRQLDAAHDRVVRRIGDAHTKAVRAIDAEGDADRRKSERAIRGIDRQADKEDERHRKAMQALEDEQDARLGILDAQLRALDAQEKSADAAERAAGIQKRIGEAQKAATAARGTGTPAQVAEARDELTRALRGGDEISIENARERLVQLAGKGNEAILKADEELADAQKDLAKESVDTARDAERDKIKVAQDAIKAEIDARKRAEDDRDRQRKDELEKDKQAEQDRLKAKLEKLDEAKQAEQDAHERSVRLDKDRTESAKQALKDQRDEQDRALKDRREAEDRTLKESREVQDRVLKDAREAEDRQIKDSREAQDRRRADERQAEDEAIEAQRKAIAKALDDEKLATEEHYNGANGVITKLKKASEDTEYQYSRQVAAVTAAFEAERKAAERVYTNPEGNGQLDLLAKAHDDEIATLDQSKLNWQQWQKEVSDAIKAAMKDLDEFIARGANVPRIGGDVPAQRSPGSGKLTSSSGASSRSGRSGKEVKGDLVSWLNDAMDITGVPDDWLPGLQKLVQLESGGDPHNQNPKDVISNGVNYGPAKGLLQTLQSTFNSYRDKNLPNDIFDPVANAVAAINYIKAKYGHVDNAVKNHAARGGYDAGGLIREPVIGRGTRSGRPYAFAEYGPEYILGRRATASLGPAAPMLNRAGMGAYMAGVHPGGSGASSIDNSAVNVYGAGTDKVVSEVLRHFKREALLHGVGRGRRG